MIGLTLTISDTSDILFYCGCVLCPSLTVWLPNNNKCMYVCAEFINFTCLLLAPCVYFAPFCNFRLNYSKLLRLQISTVPYSVSYGDS